MGAVAIADDLLKEIENFATARGVPVAQQAEEWIHEALARRASELELRGILERIAAMTPGDVAQTNSVDIIRESRNL